MLGVPVAIIPCVGELARDAIRAGAGAGEEFADVRLRVTHAPAVVLLVRRVLIGVLAVMIAGVPVHRWTPRARHGA